jgi:hypothetical protein
MPKPTRWFAAAPGGTYTPYSPSGGGRPRVFHAKEPGSKVTRCGLSAVLWSISWELPFDASAEWACPDCARRLPKPDAGP